MKIMVTLAPEDLRLLRRHVRMFEEAGVDAVGIGDSPGYHEPYVALSVAAQATDRVALGPMVTNVVTRHPQVTARALISLDELAPGRVVAGVGSGDSALAGARVERAALPVLREGLQTLRTTLQTRSADRRIRLFVTANGPRTLALGGSLGDIVVSGTGIDGGALQRAHEAVLAGARAAGRVGAVPVWAVVRVAFGRDRRDAVSRLLPLLASGANHIFRVPSEMAALSPGTGERIQRLLRAYDYTAHGRRHDNPNARLVEQLGLIDILADRLAVAGPPEEVARGLSRLHSLGLDGVVIPAVGLDVDELAHSLQAVLPALHREWAA